MNQISTLDNPLFSKLTHHKGFPGSLYVIGDIQSINCDTKFVTFVGSRSHTPASARIIEKMIRKLARYNIVIVSGLALGIDGCAHRAALDYNIPTIAFPGSGLDDSVLYPRSHRILAKRIIDQGGLLISEFKPMTKAARWTFPQRNRLMAHIADLVVVVEASESSGTLITAHAALDANIDVGVIPHSIEHAYGMGSNKLIQQGAYPILSYIDILHLLDIPQEHTTDNLVCQSQHHQIILDHLKSPQPKQELFDLCVKQLSFKEFTSSLSEMELLGLINERYGLVSRS
jgi:DNA processing protein